MKKLVGILAAAVMLFGVFTSNAAVRYEEVNGKWYCIIDYKNDNVAAMNVIGTMTGNWREPGEPMAKNAQGRWEYRFEMTRGREFYKFYDPALSGEAAYIEDPEAPEEVANPFGSKNGVLRRPAAGGAAAAAGPVEEEYPKLNFGMWSRNTYNMFFKSQLSGRVSYDADGKVDNGNEKIYSQGGELTDNPLTGKAVADANLGKRWEGEFGSTKGNATRVWLDSTKLRSSSTFKLHGMVFKHMQLDTEVNFNGTVETQYADYWKAGTAEAREAALNTIQRNAASQYMGMVFGPFASMGTWGRWVGEKNSSWDNDPDNNTIWIDQIVISFPFDDFEVKFGILGNNAAKSRDPMSLLSGKRTGWKEDIATNLEFYIHPKKVKDLNILVGAAHTWRDMSLEKGKGEVWYSGNRVDNSDRKYYAYLNADYKVKWVDFGAMWYFNSWSPAALDMFANGEMTFSPWARLTPIKGLAINAQLATNLSTIYLDSLESNDNFYDWTKYRTLKNEWDVLANSAALLSVSYVSPNFFNVGASLKAAGTTFKGMLGDDGAQFSGWSAGDRRVNGISNYTAGISPYHYNDKGASILTTLDFSINPLKNKLLTIGTREEFVIGKLDSPLMSVDFDINAQETEEKYFGYQKNKRQIDLVSTPFIGTEYKNLALNLSATFSYTNYQDDTLKIDNTQKLESTNLFTFNELVLNANIGNISKVLRSVELQYVMELGYYDAFYANTTSTLWDVMKDNIQVKNMYNQFTATMFFDKDISLGLGFIVRNYFGDQDNGNDNNKLSPNLINKMTDSDAKTYTKNLGMTSSGLLESYWTSKKDYWNIGGALQFKYVIPLEDIQFPIFFVNLGIGWNPFDDDGQTTANWYKRKDGAGNTSWDKDNTGWTQESSVITIGIQWDF